MCASSRADGIPESRSSDRRRSLVLTPPRDRQPVLYARQLRLRRARSAVAAYVPPASPMTALLGGSEAIW